MTTLKLQNKRFINPELVELQSRLGRLLNPKSRIGRQKRFKEVLDTIEVESMRYNLKLIPEPYYYLVLFYSGNLPLKITNESGVPLYQAIFDRSEDQSAKATLDLTEADDGKVSMHYQLSKAGYDDFIIDIHRDNEFITLDYYSRPVTEN